MKANVSFEGSEFFAEMTSETRRSRRKRRRKKQLSLSLSLSSRASCSRLSFSPTLIMTTSLELPGVRLAGRGGLVRKKKEFPLPPNQCSLSRLARPSTLWLLSRSLSLSVCLSLSSSLLALADPACDAPLSRLCIERKRERRTNQRAIHSFSSCLSSIDPSPPLAASFSLTSKKKNSPPHQKKTDRRRPPLHSLRRRLEKGRGQRRRRSRHLGRGPGRGDRLAELD